MIISYIQLDVSFNHAVFQRLSSAPVMRFRHPHAGGQSAHLRHDGIGSAVPARDFTRYQHRLAAQLPPLLLIYVGPQDDLRVSGLVLDGHEYSAVPALGVLPRHGPAGAIFSASVKSASGGTLASIEADSTACPFLPGRGVQSRPPEHLPELVSIVVGIPSKGAPALGLVLVPKTIIPQSMEHFSRPGYPRKVNVFGGSELTGNCP